jgi:hypothetical protein
MQNALASRMLIDQHTPHLPKDNEEVNTHMKHLQAMLDVAIMVDLALDRDDKARGHEFDHRQSPNGDSSTGLTPLEERGRRQDQDDRDLHGAIRSKDARGWIKNWHQEREGLNRSDVKRGTMTTMVPIMTNLTDSVLRREGAM